MNQSNEAAWKKAAETQIEVAAQTLRKGKSKAAAKVVTFSDADAGLTGRSTSTKPFVINDARVAKLADARDLKESAYLVAGRASLLDQPLSSSLLSRSAR
jgi:hypothetical protein